jgi:hypothetical protein
MLAATIQARPLTTLDTNQQRSSGWADTLVRMNLRARRSGGVCGFRPAEVAVGSLAGNGTAVKLGTIKLDLAGGAWQLPASEEIRTGRSLSERGWQYWSRRCRRSASVAGSDSDGKPANSFPLVWAAAIRPNGKVDYKHMCQRVKGHRVIGVDPEVSHVIRKPCLTCSEPQSQTEAAHQRRSRRQQIFQSCRTVRRGKSQSF